MQRNGFFDEEQRIKHCRYFSSDFKKKRVQELENNLISVSDICKTHRVSRTSVYRWLYKYSNMAKKQIRQVVETKSDTKKIQVLEDRIKVYYSNEFKKLTKELKMNNSMTEETVCENSHAERLNGTIKNSYLYCYAPETFEELEKELKRAVHMYNHGKPHLALNKMTPVQYRIVRSVDIDNSSSPVQSYFPKSTENHHYHVNGMIQKMNKTMSNSVNVI